MREIKFRAWDTEFKKMRLTGMGINNGVLTSEDILMQYTGLKDKKGKEIYENDIVEIENRPSKEAKAPWNTPTLGAVVWVDCGFEVDRTLGNNIHGGHCLSFLCDKVSVVGNVHENPELLK